MARGDFFDQSEQDREASLEFSRALREQVVDAHHHHHHPEGDEAQNADPPAPDYGAGARPGPTEQPGMTEILRAQWRGGA